MMCPRCGTLFEGPSCPTCGTAAQPSVYLCVRCGVAFDGAFCPNCGTPVGAPPDRGPGVREAGSVVWTLSILVFLLLLAINLAAFVYASGAIAQGALAGGPRAIPLYLLAPYPVGAVVDTGPEVFLAYFALLAAAIVAAYLWYAVRDGKATAEAFTRPLADLRGRLESRSAWVSTGQVFLAAFSFQLVIILMLIAAGFDPAPPAAPAGLPDWYLYFSLANASVYEEVVTRWLLIGVPLAVAALGLRGAATGGSTAGRIPAWRHLFGGTMTRRSPRPLLVVAAILVLFSSIVFGLAHVPAWGLWKFLPSFAAGLGMGYLFLRSGLLSAILFHFATDYFAASVVLAGDNVAIQLALGLLVLVILVLGLFFFVWYILYAIELANHLLVPGGRRPAPVAVAPAVPSWTAPSSPATPPAAAPSRQGPGYGGGFGTFTCPRCGWQEARYDAGRFTCLRCGHASP